MNRFRYGAWEWPDTLAPLMRWADGKLVDVYAFKSERQAFFYIKDLSKQKLKFPKRGESCIPLLMKLQKSICPMDRIHPAPAEVIRVHGIGTLGPASECRRISVEEYRASSAAAESAA